jgi:hypothetical protein
MLAARLLCVRLLPPAAHRCVSIYTLSLRCATKASVTSAPLAQARGREVDRVQQLELYMLRLCGPLAHRSCSRKESY